MRRALEVADLGDRISGVAFHPFFHILFRRSEARGPTTLKGRDHMGQKGQETGFTAELHPAQEEPGEGGGWYEHLRPWQGRVTGQL